LTEWIPTANDLVATHPLAEPVLQLHEQVSESLSGSLDPEPFRVTDTYPSPFVSATDLSGPASASGGRFGGTVVVVVDGGTVVVVVVVVGGTVVVVVGNVVVVVGGTVVVVVVVVVVGGTVVVVVDVVVVGATVVVVVDGVVVEVVLPPPSVVLVVGATVVDVGEVLLVVVVHSHIDPSIGTTPSPITRLSSPASALAVASAVASPPSTFTLTSISIGFSILISSGI